MNEQDRYFKPIKKTLTKKNPTKNLPNVFHKGGKFKPCTINNITTTGVPNITGGLHNINPQASLDLNRSFSSISSVKPASSLIGGDLTNLTQPEPQLSQSSFSSYLKYLNNYYDIDNMRGGNQHKFTTNEKHTTNDENTTNQQELSGAGYTIEPANFVAGIPNVVGYNDNNPPALINGQMQYSNDKQLCGYGTHKGGRHKGKTHRLRFYNTKKHTNKKTQRRNVKQL